MRKKMLAVSWGILFLLGTDHVFAGHVSSPFLKLCEAANGNAPDTSAADRPIEPGTDPGTQKALAKPARSVEDVALSERLQDLRFPRAWRCRCAMCSRPIRPVHSARTCKIQFQFALHRFDIVAYELRLVRQLSSTRNNFADRISA